MIAIDKSISEINDGLFKALPWLTHAFGRAYRLIKQTEEGRYSFPAVYKQGNDYEDVSPSEDLGNFSFVWISDPQRLQWSRSAPIASSVPMSIIFWLDTRTITADRNVEQIKADILLALQEITLSRGSFSISTVYEQASNIYKEFNLDETKNQFMIHPFVALRFDGELLVKEPCGYNR